MTVTVRDWTFDPPVIRSRKGQRLTLRLVGVEGVHGFSIASLGISTVVSAGETKTVSVPTGRVGVYTYFCSAPCGKGHDDMTGVLIIQ